MRNFIKSIILDQKQNYQKSQKKEEQRTIAEILESIKQLESEKEIDDLIDSTLTFYFAGKETTALFLEMLFYYLSEYPKVFDSVKDEIK